MLVKIAKVMFVVLLLLVIGLLLFLMRPWADYSPRVMNDLFHPSKRVENFRHMDEVFPYRTIPALLNTTPLLTASQPVELEYRYKGQAYTLTDFLERVESTGFLVLKDNHIIDERYANGATATDRFTSWSVAKSFVSTLVGIALAEGKITSVMDPVTKYVPELNNTAYADVPIKHILQMTSGVDFKEVYGQKFSDINKLFMRTFIIGQRVEDVVASYPRAEASGQRFEYVSIDTQVLAKLLRAVYQQDLTHILAQKLWQPLGMEADAYWNIDEDSAAGVEIGFCCINARLRDFGRFGQLFANRGVWNGQQIVSAQWVEEATRAVEPHLMPEQARNGVRGYQYQWWTPPEQEGDYFASGVWGQYIYVSEPDNLVIVRTSVDPKFNDHMEETIVVFRAIRDQLRRQAIPQ